MIWHVLSSYHVSLRFVIYTYLKCQFQLDTCHYLTVPCVLDDVLCWRGMSTCVVTCSGLSWSADVVFKDITQDDVNLNTYLTPWFRSFDFRVYSLYVVANHPISKMTKSRLRVIAPLPRPISHVTSSYDPGLNAWVFHNFAFCDFEIISSQFLRITNPRIR